MGENLSSSHKPLVAHTEKHYTDKLWGGLELILADTSPMWVYQTDIIILPESILIHDFAFNIFIKIYSSMKIHTTYLIFCNL